MATRVVHVSDLSGALITDEEQHCKLVIHAHPRYNGRTGLPVELDCTEQELSGVNGQDVVIAEAVGLNGRRESLAILLEDFDRLADGGLDAAIQEALVLQRGSRRAGVGPPDGERSTGRRRPPGAGRTAAYYATLEHAGEPHRGRITEAEAEIVRDNLDQVNERLRSQGLREIDPADEKMRARYGLDAPQDADAPS